LAVRGPWISLLNPESNPGHYVVVTGTENGEAAVLDPIGWWRVFAESGFLKLWADRASLGGAVFH